MIPSWFGASSPRFTPGHLRGQRTLDQVLMPNDSVTPNTAGPTSLSSGTTVGSGLRSGSIAVRDLGLGTWKKTGGDFDKKISSPLVAVILKHTPYLFPYEMIILHTYEMKFPTLIL